jgi:hypothetical protein
MYNPASRSTSVAGYMRNRSTHLAQQVQRLFSLTLPLDFHRQMGPCPLSGSTFSQERQPPPTWHTPCFTAELGPSTISHAN